MTREEAIVTLQEKYRECKSFYDLAAHPEEVYPGTTKFLFALELALYALRTISREQVENGWRGEWIIQQDEHREFFKKCSKCGFPISGWWGADKFCANCGAPMTDEAMELVMDRLEGIK